MAPRPGEHRPFDVDALRADIDTRMRRLARDEELRREAEQRARAPRAPVRLQDELDAYLPPRREP